MLFKAAKNTSTTALRTPPRRSEYLSCLLLLALYRAPRQGGEAWSKLACFTFRAHFLVCCCILNSKIAFKTLFYREDTDYWVCLCLKNTWLGQCPLDCHAVLGCFTTIPACGLGVAPLCLRCHGSQIERGYITMRQTTSRIVMYAWLVTETES